MCNKSLVRPHEPWIAGLLGIPSCWCNGDHRIPIPWELRLVLHCPKHLVRGQTTSWPEPLRRYWFPTFILGPETSLLGLINDIDASFEYHQRAGAPIESPSCFSTFCSCKAPKLHWTRSRDHLLRLVQIQKNYYFSICGKAKSLNTIFHVDISVVVSSELRKLPHVPQNVNFRPWAESNQIQ